MTDGRHRVFLLSPAQSGGPRAQLITAKHAVSPLAQRLRSAGVPLGELFTFVSGLYFRGKLAYAQRFARPPDPRCPVTAGGVLVITPGAGLVSADTLVTLEVLKAFARIDITSGNPRFRRPLLESARRLAERVGPACEVVLLGSVASGKYTDVLLGVFGSRLLFPGDFVGRGDMSRGGLLLRSVRAGVELEYAPVLGAVVHGPRPPRLTPVPRAR